MTCRTCGRDHVAERRRFLACDRGSVDQLLGSTFDLLPDDIATRLAIRQQDVLAQRRHVRISPAKGDNFDAWTIRTGYNLDLALRLGSL